jgi:hypothetical protein
MANKFLSNRPYERTNGFDYKSHFNAKLNKCFVFISDYDIKNDISLLNVFDAVEGKHYAEFDGHPSDFTVGFRGLRFGGGAGDENTQQTFRDHVQPFMND